MISMVIFRLAPDGFISFHASHYRDEQDFRCVCARWSQSRFFFPLRSVRAPKSIGMLEIFSSNSSSSIFSAEKKASHESKIVMSGKLNEFTFSLGAAIVTAARNHCPFVISLQFTFLSFPTAMEKHFRNENCRQIVVMTQHGGALCLEVRESTHETLRQF